MKYTPTLEIIGYKDCYHCKFWSMTTPYAGNPEGGRSMCLHPDSRHYGKFVVSGCSKRKTGVPVDDPRRTV